MTGNGIASADDFRTAMLAEFGNPEPVSLPKLGKKVMLRRPSSTWFLFNGRLPITMASRMANHRQSSDSKQMVEDIIESAEWVFHVITNVMVEPRCVTKPRPDKNEISPDMVSWDDAMFIVRWAQGEEVNEAKGLSTFSGKGSGPEPGADGRTVEL